MVLENPLVSVASCGSYEIGAIRRAIAAAVTPLGGIRRFVRPGMRVLLKPNLVSDAHLERAATTHPAVVEAAVQLVREAGGTVWIGDSPGGPVASNARVYRNTGMTELARRLGADMLPFDRAVWKRARGRDHFVASPVVDADLVINLPKLKTHVLTLYTGAVKNLFGVVPGTRKRELHCQAPGVSDFGQILVDVLELVRPGLSILDGVLGQEGNGPGAGGTPRCYGCIAASTDPVALDAVVSRAMGYRRGEVIHLAQAGSRGLGVSEPSEVRIDCPPRGLDFGRVRLPKARWYLRAPSWVGAPVRLATRIRPRLIQSACVGCERCVAVCPTAAITRGQPPLFDLDSCIGCLCCVEICPEGAIEPQRNLIARLIGLGQ